MQITEKNLASSFRIIIHDGDVYALDMHGAREKENKRAPHV